MITVVDLILTFVLLFDCINSYPALQSLWKSHKNENPQHTESGDKCFEDEDGNATIESQVRYLAALRPGLLSTLVALGLGISLLTAILELLWRQHTTESWFIFGLWVCSFFQSTAFSLERRPCPKFTIANSLVLSAILTILGQAVTVTEWHPPTIFGTAVAAVALRGLKAFQALVACATLLTVVNTPRRPTLFFQDFAVDDQYTVSLIQRLSFAWASSTLRRARYNGTSLNLSDLPVLHNVMRANSLRWQFTIFEVHPKMWKKIYFCHKWDILKHYVLAILHSGAQFISQWVMYQLLRLLEQRSRETIMSNMIWWWVAAMGFSIFFAAWLETQILWIVNTKLVVPLRSELTTRIYAKVLTKKNVVNAPKQERPQSSREVEIDLLANVPGNIGCANGAKAKGSRKSGDPLKASQVTNNDTINLVALDTKRVTDFMGVSFLIPASIFKLAISLTFLLYLIGWESILSGLAALSLLNVLNVYFSRRMNAAQSHLMRARDSKMSLVNEALQGIRQIKFTATEAEWLEIIRERRDEELSVQWYLFKLRTVLVGFWQIGPILFSAVSLAVYVALTGSLTPSVAFTTLAIFGQIEGSLAILPKLIVQIQQTAISLGRIQRFLDAADQSIYLGHRPNQRAAVMEFACLTWPTDSTGSQSRFALRDISVSFPAGKLSVISGDTGSGKSLLLNALVGEAEMLSGSVSLSLPSPYFTDDGSTSQFWAPGSDTAYVSQNVWIENATIRNNILFGLPFYKARYQQTIFACALTKDLEMLTDGDATEVGVGGINLSGGQKWRLSFARALYSQARVLVIDDIFSAVDAHVGQHMYNKALTGPLAMDRTRILATHHVGLCATKANYFIRLDHGRVVEQRCNTRDSQKQLASDQAELERKMSSPANFPSESLNHFEEASDNPKGSAGGNIPNGAVDAKKSISVPRKFIEEEKREHGAVRAHTYKFYFSTAGGVIMFLFVVCAHLLYTASIMGRSWWLSVWTRQTERAESVQRPMAFSVSQAHLGYSYHSFYGLWLDGNVTKDKFHFYLTIYLGISFLVCTAGIIKFFSVLVGSIKASKRLFEDFTWKIFHAPIRWFDTVPTGRILNRFTSDFESIDSSMADGMGFFLTMCFQLLAILIAGVVVSPLIILVAILLLLISVYVAALYLPGARDVKRLESVTRSPLFEQLQSTILGVETIRAYGKAETYIGRMMNRIDDLARTSYYRNLFNMWLMLRLNMIGATFTTAVAAVIAARQNIDASLAGFALSFALQYTVAIEWTIRQFSATQLAMNSTERILEYSVMNTEPCHGQPVPSAWPANGRVDIHDLVVDYEPGEAVLKGITMHVEPRERVGIVGRTGSGKTTLSLSLFRFLEATSGTISIDGIDIALVKLHDLRSRLAIIPQDPVLFTGTFRSNLDPFNEHTDSELCDALERVHLDLSTGREGEVSASDQGTKSGFLGLLPHHIHQGGHNLSQGQRQLLCMARAMISRHKILIMDEATSSVDMETDAAIQKSIRGCFKDCTLIVIAHRLSTLVDFDKIFVLEAGRVVEYGSPEALLLRKGAFWDLVQESGERETLEKMIQSPLRPE